MNSSNDRARLESALSRAHRALYDAQQQAELLGDVSGHDCLYDLMTVVGSLMERSLSSNPNGRIPGQMALMSLMALRS